MTQTKKTLWAITALTLIIALIATFYVGADTRVAVHWARNGTVNGHMPAWLGFGLLPVIQAVCLVAMGAAPLKWPQGLRASGPRVGAAIGFCVILALLAFELMLIAAATGLGGSAMTAQGGMLILGMVLAITGNQMPKLEPNGFAGIRTPWTRRDPEVWRKTHALFGPIFLLVGLCVMAVSIGVPSGKMIHVVLILILPAALGSVLYSAWLGTRPKNR